jgi:hypothetical protein
MLKAKALPPPGGALNWGERLLASALGLFDLHCIWQPVPLALGGISGQPIARSHGGANLIRLIAI